MKAIMNIRTLIILMMISVAVLYYISTDSFENKEILQPLFAVAATSAFVALLFVLKFKAARR